MADFKRVELYVGKMLSEGLGLDLSDPNLADTPARVAKAYKEIFSGMENTEEQIKKILSSRFPAEDFDEMITIRDHITYSMCPHHFLPVEYVCNVSYIPSVKEGFVLGASKLARLADVLAARPVLQETFTRDIGRYLNEVIKPIGVAVHVKGTHFCMKMRGVKSPNSSMVTTCTLGVYRTNHITKAEFFNSIKTV